MDLKKLMETLGIKGMNDTRTRQNYNPYRYDIL